MMVKPTPHSIVKLLHSSKVRTLQLSDPNAVVQSAPRFQQKSNCISESVFCFWQTFESSFSEGLIVRWFDLGNFGKVHPGIFQRTNGEKEPVAVKTLKSGNNSTGKLFATNKETQQGSQLSSMTSFAPF